MKKKLLILITALMLILNLKYDVKADGEAPSSSGYKVVVKNTKGAALYEDGKVVTTIPYKGVANVVYEGYDDNNKKILYVTYKNYDGFWSYYVKAEDVIPKEYSLSDANKLDQKREALVLNKNGGILREGPSEVYDELQKKIPTGTTITYQYVDNGYGLWAYVEYDGVKGWLWRFSGAKDSNSEYAYVVDKAESYIKLLTIGKNAKLYSSVYTEKDEIVATIPTNTKLDCKYEYVNSCYVEYNGQFGWVDFDENFVYSGNYYDADEGKLLIIYDTPLYKDFDFKNKYNITIPNNTFLSDFYYKEYADEPGFLSPYYINYKNQFGWLNEESVAYCYESELNEPKTVNKELSIYDKPDINSEIISTIPNGTTIKTHCEKTIYGETESYSWVFVEYDDVTGWVIGKSLYDDEIIIDDEDNEAPNEEPKKDTNNWFKSLTPLQFSLLCIGGACILAETSIVIIILIKKNNDKKAKKNKKEDNQQIISTEAEDKTKQVETKEETVKIEAKQETTEEQIPIKK